MSHRYRGAVLVLLAVSAAVAGGQEKKPNPRTADELRMPKLTRGA